MYNTHVLVPVSRRDLLDRLVHRLGEVDVLRVLRRRELGREAVAHHVHRHRRRRAERRLPEVVRHHADLKHRQRGMA